MPYKDQKKRRTYQCEYKRRQRAMEKMSNPVCQTMSNPLKFCQTLSQTMKRKAYLCPKVPNLRLPGIVFKNGFFVTDRPEEQDRIQTRSMEKKFLVGWLIPEILTNFNLTRQVF